MPAAPVTKTIALPVETAADVAELVDTARAVGQLESASKRSAISRDLADHFAYLAGTRPQLFKPHQERVASFTDTELVVFGPAFEDLALLMEGADDNAVMSLVERLRDRPDHFVRMWMLAAIGSASALEAAAEHARAHGCRATFEEIGVEIPEAGPASWRFSRNRLAVFKRATRDVAAAEHPVGLAINEVVASPQGAATWHASITTTGLDLGISLPERLHLVGPRRSCDWTIFFAVDDQSRYCFPTAVLSEDGDDDDEDMFRGLERADGDEGQLELRPYDADLVYCNGHILLTEAVVGTVGGPPIGLYPNPRCPTCARMMFHVMSVQHHVREYGDGFRSIYYCEDCSRAACTATNWN
jgi:hypothetical protein